MSDIIIIIIIIIIQVTNQNLKNIGSLTIFCHVGRVVTVLLSCH